MIINTLLTVSAIIIACFTIAADNFYRDYLTGFEDISDYSNLESGCIEIANNKKERIIETHEFLTKDGETVEEAKARLAEEHPLNS